MEAKLPCEQRRVTSGRGFGRSLPGFFSHIVLLCLLILQAPVTQAQGSDSLFWSIGKDGEPGGYLLGTIHSEDPRVLDFPESFIGRLIECRFFAMEMVPDLPTLQKLTEYMHYQDGSTLESRIGPERYARLRSVLQSYQVPPDWVTRMKIWAAMMTISVPPPQTGLFMDFSLSLRAAGAGLKVVGLESLDEQLSFLEQMPESQQLALLDQALNDHEQVADVHTRMVDSYLTGDVAALQKTAEEQLDELAPEARAYFMEQGIDARNRRMLDSILPLFEAGKVFVAVGALHLPGENGLVEMLRRNGYTLKPLPLPLNVEAPASGPGSAQPQRN